jgi:Pyruvate/2-oxoacid:ferredoxin oxidoreductase gamma subunit
LGAVGYLTKVATLKNLKAALKARVPKGTDKMNIKAFDAGVAAAKLVNLSALPSSVMPQDEEI